MKSINRTILPVIALLLGSFSYQNSIAAEYRSADQSTIQTTANQSALDVARQDPSLSIMVEAIEASGLSSMLRFAGNDYTIFAPNNAAFNRLFAQTGLTKQTLFGNKEAVRVLLAYHIVQNNHPLYTNNLVSGKIKTYNNRYLTVTSQRSIVDGRGRTARIIRPNIPTQNGVVHVIDNVMFPMR